MRVILFLIAALMAVMITMVAGATDNERERTIIITGSKVIMEDSVTLSVFDDITITGFVEGDDQNYRSQKRSEVRFSPTADIVRIVRLKKSRGVFGQVCLLGGDSSSTEVLENVPSIRLGPGEWAEVTWRLPEKCEPVVVQRPKRHRDNRRQHPEELLFSGPSGDYFWVKYSGEEPSINPGYPVWWGIDGRCQITAITGVELVPTWEMVGDQLTKTSLGVPTVMITLGGYGKGLMWRIFPELNSTQGDPLNPNGGQLHFALRDKWGRGLITGVVPSLAVESLANPQQFKRYAHWDGQRWSWVE